MKQYKYTELDLEQTYNNNKLIFVKDSEKTSKWINRWVHILNNIKEFSGDTSTKVSALAVSPNQSNIIIGWNDFPRNFDEFPEYRERPQKYDYTEHAERNLIYNAARQSVSIENWDFYSSLFACPDCTRGIVQSGAAKYYSFPPDFSKPYKHDISIEILYRSKTTKVYILEEIN